MLIVKISRKNIAGHTKCPRESHVARVFETPGLKRNLKLLMDHENPELERLKQFRSQLTDRARESMKTYDAELCVHPELKTISVNFGFKVLPGVTMTSW